MPPTYTPTRTMTTARWLDGALHPDVQYKGLGWGFVTENILFSVCYSEHNTFYTLFIDHTICNILCFL